MLDFTKYNQLLDTMNLNRNPIPIDYSNKLTTSRWLMEITELLKQVINDVNKALVDMNSYTDSEIEKVMTVVNQNYNNLIQLISTTKTEILTYTNEEIGKIQLEIQLLSLNLNEEIAKLKIEDSKLNNRIIELYNMLEKGVVFVTSPVTGLLVQVQTAINDLFDWCNMDEDNRSLTADLFESFALTAEEFETKNITAIAFNRNWKEIFE